MHFFLRITVDGSTDSWDICDEIGLPVPGASDAFCHEIVEAKVASWRERTNDAPPVEFWEWLNEEPISEWCPAPTEGGPDMLYGPFTATQLVTLVSRYNPKPWKGHPAREG